MAASPPVNGAHTPTTEYVTQRLVWNRVDLVAAAMAVAAFLWHVLLMSGAANDNFMHMAMAQQWLAGDWPVRDFFDNGRLLQYSLSALAQWTIGNRLLGEAVIVGLFWAISTYLVFVLVRQLTGALPAAVLASLMLIVAGARGYSYPKGVVYAVAAVLWWAYVRRPRIDTMVVFGAWVAVAYYWRPDHGVYTAFALVLAAIAAHGLRLETVRRVALAGATTVTLVVPFWAYIHATVGLPAYASTGVEAIGSEHGTHGQHVWPILRFGERMLMAEPQEQYAPVVNIRWSAGSDHAAREAVRARYGLTTLEVDGESERLRLSASSISQVGALIREPIVEDTAGIDRSTGTLLPSDWPATQRRKFEHAWLRLQLLPDLDARGRAAEYSVALFLLLPIVLLIASPWIAPRLIPAITPLQLSAFAVFAFAVAFAMLREPFNARVADAVVLCTIALALITAWLWRAGGVGWQVRSVMSKAIAVGLMIVTTMNVAVTGQFDQLLGGLDLAGARAIGRELTASPPLSHYIDSRARFTLQLAAYARGCLPPSERVLVLWFEPEIPYFSQRLLAQHHLVYPPAWGNLATAQSAAIAKVTRYKPSIVFGLASALDRTARVAFPSLVEYVERDYQLAAKAEDGGEEYLIYTRKDRPALASFGPHHWPCFVENPEPWVRVGVPVTTQ